MKLQTLLLVEDNNNDIVLTERVIKHVAPSVEMVIHKMGETALDYLQTTLQPPQLILLDLGLPGIDGVEFIRLMRLMRGFKPIPVVIVTGWATEIIRANAAQIATDYIIKPIERQEFEQLLTKLGLEV